MRHHLRGALVFVLTLGLTSGALARPARARRDPGAGARARACSSRPSTVATVTRYVALRTWVFARRAGAPRAGRAAGGAARPQQ